MSTVNAEVVLAALARIEEVAAERSTIQSVRLSIIRRQVVSLQRQIEQQATSESPAFCDQCAGPYPRDAWPGSQYGGHWDTCPNRLTKSEGR